MDSSSGMRVNTEQLANQVGVGFGTGGAATRNGDIYPLRNEEHQLQDSRWLDEREREGERDMDGERERKGRERERERERGREERERERERGGGEIERGREREGGGREREGREREGERGRVREREGERGERERDGGRVGDGEKTTDYLCTDTPYCQQTLSVGRPLGIRKAPKQTCMYI